VTLNVKGTKRYLAQKHIQKVDHNHISEYVISQQSVTKLAEGITNRYHNDFICTLFMSFDTLDFTEQSRR